MARAHEYLVRLPPEKLSAVRGLLETMLDPVSRALANAPTEDEEISPEEEQAVAQSLEWLKHHKPIPHEEVLAEFGADAMPEKKYGETSLGQRLHFLVAAGASGRGSSRGEHNVG